jgi:hypothetical protein
MAPEEKSKPAKPAMVTLEKWRAAMLAAGIPRMQAAPTYRLTMWTRSGIVVKQLRLRLGSWVAGRDLDDW